MENEKKYEKIKDALFQSNVHYDENGKYWVMTYTNARGEVMKHSFPTKPAWLESIECCNKILLSNADPIGLRVLHDSLWDIAVKADNITSTTLDRKPLDEFLSNLHNRKTLSDLRAIYKIKFIDEGKSCRAGGSMPSAQCSTIRRLSNILGAIDARLAKRDRFISFLQKPYRSSFAPTQDRHL